MADGLRARFEMEGGRRLGDVRAWLKDVKDKHGFSDDAIVTSSRTTGNQRVLVCAERDPNTPEPKPKKTPDVTPPPPVLARPVPPIRGIVDVPAPDVADGLESLRNEFS